MALFPASEVPEDVVACVRLLGIALQAPEAGGESIAELDGIIDDLESIIQNLDELEEKLPASIGHLVGGHLYLYARDPNGYRAGFLEDAQNHFAAADQWDREAFLRAFAKLRMGTGRRAD
jgi:ABC-type Fe3+-hydroxamate transport system substrate-binding protein